MTSPRSALRNRAEDLLMGGLDGLIRRLPDRTTLALMRGVADGCRWLLPGRRRTAYACIESTLGHARGSPEAQAIVRGAFRILALNAAETELVQRRLRRDPEALSAMVELEGAEHMRSALDSGRGVLLCTGHLGAWELFPTLMARLYAPVWIMARKLTNPLLEQRVRAGRQADLKGVVPKVGGGRQLARILRAREPLAMVLDQNASAHGIVLDFLGRPSSHHKVAGVVARRFGALAVPFYVIRRPGVLRFRLAFEPAIEADPDLSQEQAEVDVTRRLSASLEQRVRAHPEQWLWLHDRWRKHRRGKPVAREVLEASGEAHRPAAEGTNGS